MGALGDVLEQARIAAMAKAVAPKTTPHYCRTCNREVGAKWLATCPHCCSMRSVVPGIPERADALWLGGGGKPTLLKDVLSEDHERIMTGTRELDRVLGGGLVMGGVVLISGDPGIGKSTLLLQVSVDLSIAPVTDDETNKRTDSLVILYVSAEETNSQIKDRAKRIASDSKQLYLYNEHDVFEIEKHIAELRPDVLIIDSIQTMFKPDIEGGAGSITQVRECASFIISICKKNRIGCFIVAHINKENIIAGPKTLEHLVDTTLEFHKEGLGELRSIRTAKNRFGSTDEMALFRMTKDGLKSIENPSELLLEHHKDGRQAGICVGLVARGPRPLAVEVQTLLGPSFARTGVGAQHKRTMTGLSSSRATQVIAVLQRRIGLDLNREVFVNVPGGLDEIRDPALDLPLALALASYVFDVALPESFIAYGEIGLAGEIRPVTYSEARIKSAALMGFKKIMGPVMPSYEAADILATLTSSSPDPAESDDDDGRGDGKEGLAERYFGVATLEEAFELLDGFVITPHEPKLSEMRPEKRKKPAKDGGPNLYVVKKGPEKS